MPGISATDRAVFVEHRRVQRQHRRRLGDAVALEDANPEFLAPDIAGRLLDRLGPGDDIADRAEIIGVGRARIAGQECVSAKEDRRVGAVDQLRHDAVVQRRRIEIYRHAGNQRQHKADRQPETMEDRQHVEHFVGTAEINARRRLGGVGQNIAMREHDALWRALGPRRKEDRRRIMRPALDQRAAMPQNSARNLSKRVTLSRMSSR